MVRNHESAERRLQLLVGYRYVPHHLEGLVALLLFFVALMLGAAVAIILRALPSGV